IGALALDVLGRLARVRVDAGDATAHQRVAHDRRCRDRLPGVHAGEVDALRHRLLLRGPRPRFAYWMFANAGKTLSGVPLKILILSSSLRKSIAEITGTRLSPGTPFRRTARPEPGASVPKHMRSGVRCLIAASRKLRS